MDTFGATGAVILILFIISFIKKEVKNAKDGYNEGKAIKETANKVYSGCYTDDKGVIRHIETNEIIGTHKNKLTGDKYVGTIDGSIIVKNISEEFRRKEMSNPDYKNKTVLRMDPWIQNCRYMDKETGEIYKIVDAGNYSYYCSGTTNKLVRPTDECMEKINSGHKYMTLEHANNIIKHYNGEW